ncbi:MAG: FAD-dependent oxidoreductase [Prevotellaceae bacterium]|nr:FAD-dependent oxidoreductase [Prevotellaceae bacterium]
MKHIIIGGVAGGATAAARIRRIDEQAEIILVEKGDYISYANCGLPYYIGDVIKDRDKLFVQTPESFGRRFAIDVRNRQEVTAIDVQKKSVTIRKRNGSIYEESFDKLLLSPGSMPVRPPLPGIDNEGIFTLRNVDDTDNIKKYLQTHRVNDAVVVGGGFIGLEMAENLHHAGARVSVVEMANQVMAPVDFTIAAHVHRHLTDRGVDLYLEKGVERFEKAGCRLRVCLAGGEEIVADLVLLSIGVRPSAELATAAGIALGGRGIKVDEYLQTSVPDIYAVGDVVEYPHPLTGEPWLNYLANPANRQGRIVADNMVRGNHVKYEGAVGTSIAKVFDLTVGSTGLAAKRLKQLQLPYRSSTTISSSHAGYYPGATPLVIKLTFHPESGKIWGAQCVGHEGVDKRIDQIALLIKTGGTIDDLIRLEHTYAPPFSSAKDPIAIAGYTAKNVLTGDMPVITWRELAEGNFADKVLLDVRTVEEHALGSIPGAVNIPLDDLRERIDELPKDKEIIIFCAVGLRGYLALRILQGRGFTGLRNLSGGYNTYRLAIMKPQRHTPTADVTNRLQPFRPEPGTLKIVDACGLQCPGPILQLKKTVDAMTEGEAVRVVATDPGFPNDASAWCQTTGNRLLSSHTEDGRYVVTIEKGKRPVEDAHAVAAKNKTLIMFSDDLDRALATFVLANGAAATGHKVSIFFTFWGLNVIKKEHKPSVRKDFFGKMFGMMMPSHSKKLKLSQMSFMGMGDRLMRHIMKQKNIDSLESLRQQALDNGVEFIACQMSMDMMGIKKEELIDGVNVGGVATYMNRAEDANVNLFI